MIAGIGLIVLVLVGGLFLTSRGGNSSKPTQTAMAPVVVALQSIPQNTSFTAGEPLNAYFTVRQLPKDAVPFGAYTSVQQIASFLKSTGCQPSASAGCRGTFSTTQTIYQNLPVVAGMFTSLGQFRTVAGPAFQIPYGYVGIAVSFSDVNSVLGSIQPGDDIDIIASYTGAEGGNTKNDAPKQTQYVMNDMRVIGVGGPPPAPANNPASGTKVGQTATQTQPQTAGGTLLLMVRYQQALLIQHLKDFGGSWQLSAVLRSSKETDIPHFRTTPVTGRWMFVKQQNHFDFTLPY